MSEGYVGAPTAKGGNGCAWVVGIVAACGLLLVLGVAALAGFGWSLFSKEAQQVLQRDPVESTALVQRREARRGALGVDRAGAAGSGRLRLEEHHHAQEQDDGDGETRQRGWHGGPELGRILLCSRRHRRHGLTHPPGRQ